MMQIEWDEWSEDLFFQDVNRSSRLKMSLVFQCVPHTVGSMYGIFKPTSFS